MQVQRYSTVGRNPFMRAAQGVAPPASTLDLQPAIRARDSRLIRPNPDVDNAGPKKVLSTNHAGVEHRGHEVVIAQLPGESEVRGTVLREVAIAVMVPVRLDLRVQQELDVFFAGPDRFRRLAAPNRDLSYTNPPKPNRRASLLRIAFFNRDLQAKRLTSRNRHSFGKAVSGPRGTGRQFDLWPLCQIPGPTHRP